MSRETLLQRLRQYEGAQWETTACYNGLRDEAANEIDRLRAALEQIANTITYHLDPRAADDMKAARAALAKEAGK